MKIFFGTIFTLIFIGLACFAGYFAYDLYFNNHTQSDSQSSKDVQQSQGEESYQNNDTTTESSPQTDHQLNETPSQQTDEETSENNDSIKQTSPNKPFAQQSVYLTDAEKNEREQLEQKKLDAMAGQTTMSATESERFRDLTARFEASKTLDENH